jgi:hypothetical protein
MEYGIFLESHLHMVRFLLFWGALSVFVILVANAIGTYNRYVWRRTSFRKEKTGEYSSKTIFLSIAAAGSFLMAIALLIMGLWTGGGNTQECSNEGYVSAGYYKIVESKLIYNWEALTHLSGRPLLDKDGNPVYGPTKPNYFELKVEGRADSKENPNLKMVRCIKIPYTQVAENHTFLPSVTPETKNVPVTLPAFAKKQSDGWWQFTQIGP